MCCPIFVSLSVFPPLMASNMRIPFPPLPPPLARSPPFIFLGGEGQRQGGKGKEYLISPPEHIYFSGDTTAALLAFNGIVGVPFYYFFAAIPRRHKGEEILFVSRAATEKDLSFSRVV